MKTILLVSNVSPGLLNFQHELIETLVKDHKVVILASDTGRAEECKAMGCEYHEFPMATHGTNPLSELKLISAYKKEINHNHRLCRWYAQAPLAPFTSRVYRLIEFSFACVRCPAAIEIAVGHLYF